METFQYKPEAPTTESDLFFKEGLGRQIGTVALEANVPELSDKPAMQQEQQGQAA